MTQSLVIFFCFWKKETFSNERFLKIKGPGFHKLLGRSGVHDHVCGDATHLRGSAETRAVLSARPYDQPLACCFTCARACARAVVAMSASPGMQIAPTGCASRSAPVSPHVPTPVMCMMPVDCAVALCRFARNVRTWAKLH